MADTKPSLLRTILSLPVQIVVAIFVVLDGIVAPLFRPLMRFLSSLRLVQRLETLIASLPPYVILVLLVVPFGFAEIAKVYAVLMMGEGRFKIGVTIFIAAYVVSILVCERIFHAGKGQLMTIGWFKIAFDWVMGVKDRLLAWFHQTWAGQLAADIRQRGRLFVRRARTGCNRCFRPNQRASSSGGDHARHRSQLRLRRGFRRLCAG